MKFLKKLLTFILIIGLIVTYADEIGGIIRTVRNQLTVPDDLTRAERTVYSYAAAHGLSYGDYPASLIELLERNPETKTFVLEYPTREDRAYDLSEYADATTVPLFLQWDQRWGMNPTAPT